MIFLLHVAYKIKFIYFKTFREEFSVLSGFNFHNQLKLFGLWEGPWWQSGNTLASHL